MTEAAARENEAAPTEALIENHADFRLGNHLPYLLARTAGRSALSFSKRTAEFGLTLKMWRVLSVLFEYEELRLSDIAHLTAIDMSTLSRLVSTMHKRRLIGRRRSPKSKREIIITLAPAGKEGLDTLIPEAQIFESVLTDGTSPEDIETTKATLRRLFENLDKLAPMSGPTFRESLLKTL